MRNDIFKFKKINEADIDTIIKNSGGKRIEPIQNRKTADYVLNESIIELKIIEEDGFLKEERQKKLAELFLINQQDCPTVILHPHLLSDGQVNEYEKTIETPIKKHIKTANKQFKETAITEYHGKLKVLLLINIGYNFLWPEEFNKIAIKRVKNDTTNIDFLVTAGIYFHSDGFDSYFLFSFEQIKIKNSASTFYSFPLLKENWNNYIEGIMTNIVLGKTNEDYKILAECDVDFQYRGKYFVRPLHRLEKKSDFYKNGRPRKNTTGINKSPPVGIIFPYLSKNDWEKSMRFFKNKDGLRKTYSNYIDFYNKFNNEDNELFMPNLIINVEYDLFSEWCLKNNKELIFNNMKEYSCELFSKKISKIGDSAININDITIFPVIYMYLLVKEIGNDKKYDYSTLKIIKKGIINTDEIIIFEKEKMFFEYALCVASSYALKNNIDIIIYDINKDYGWH